MSKSDDMSLEEPPMKQQKLNQPAVTVDELVSQYLLKLRAKERSLKVVLADDYLNPVPLTKAYMGCIKDAKNISTAIRLLNENMPLNELIHLKRARGRNILLCHSNKLSTNCTVQEFIEKHIPELENMFENFSEVDVPAIMPKLKWQYAQVSKKWACNFHPDNYAEKLFSGDLNLNLETRYTYMQINFEIVKWYCKDKRMDITDDFFNSVNASVVVDPSIKSVVAVSFDHRTEHPIQHSAMIAIDNVARTQGGGAWPSKNYGKSNLSGIDKDLLVYLKEKFPNVKFGAKECVNKNSITDVGKDYDMPYLCTNYYVYLLREPCIMCSMALTHARVKRVFFCFENKELGGLMSRAKLHTVPYLNHHYEVFTGFL